MVIRRLRSGDATALVVLGFGVIIALGIVLWIVSGSEEEAGEDEPEVEASIDDGDGHRADEVVDRFDPVDDPAAPTEEIRSDPEADDALVVDEEDDEQDASVPDDDRKGSDNGEAGADETPEGLGPRRWMADAEEADDVDTQELERRLDEGRMRQEFELSRQEDRFRSIDEVRPHVERCYREISVERLELDDRVALEWTMRTEGGVGRIEEPAVVHHRGPPDEGFNTCIVDAVEGLEFEAVGDGASLQVRWTNIDE